MMDLIPAIDLKGGHCVRLFQGEYDRETRYSDDPVAVAKEFARTGCSRLHLVDLDGARSGEQENREIVKNIINATNFEVQLGGGLRKEAQLVDWLDVGVTRLVIGSLAISDKPLVRQWLRKFDPSRIILALDVRLDDQGTPRPATHGWTQDAPESLWDCLDAYLDSGLQQVLCTDISRDGAMSGPNTLLYREIMQRYPALELTASGGVRNTDDLHALRAAGLPSVVSGRALLDKRISIEEVSSFLRDE